MDPLRTFIMDESADMRDRHRVAQIVFDQIGQQVQGAAGQESTVSGRLPVWPPMANSRLGARDVFSHGLDKGDPNQEAEALPRHDGGPRHATQPQRP